jgi:carbamoyl-phosphate synthase large subunit
MTDLTVLVTGCGAPGFPGTLWSLRHNYDDRALRVVGTDMNDAQAGRYLADAFHRVPAADDEAFVPELLSICRTESVDVVLPQVTRELPVLADAKAAFADAGTAVAVADPSTIARANDKGALVDRCEALGVPAPETTRVSTAADLRAACADLGHPDRPVVVKPPTANGSRGMRILDPDRDRKRAFYEDKPTGRYATLDGLVEVLGESFPELLVMEYLPGTEYTVDVFRPPGGGEVVAIPRRRDSVTAGISFRGSLARHEGIIEATRRLADDLGLAYAFGFQFKKAADGEPKILECNPRVQGTMVTSTFARANVTYSAIKAALDEPVPSFDPAWDRSFHRYWGGIGVVNDAVVGNVGEL